MSLVWREQLSVGNNVIDTDHRYLIDIINRVGQSLNTRSRQDLVAGLDSLAQYAQEHFAREEKIAKAAGYQQVPHLSVAHQELLKQLDQVKQEVGGVGQEWSTETADDFTKLLRHWLIEHVIKEDMLMKPVLTKLSPLFDPR